MKKLIALLLASALMLALCACGGKSYTAVPELKISWDMGPQEVQKANSFETTYMERDDGYSFVTCKPGQKLPRIADVPVSVYMCIFDHGKLIQVIVSIQYSETLKGKVVSYDYSKVVSLFTKEYGQPTMKDSKGSGYVGGVRTVWILDGRSIEVKGNLNFVTDIVFYANPSGEEAASADTADAASPAATPAERESPEERCDRFLEDLSGKWISASNNYEELEFYQNGQVSVNWDFCTITYLDEIEEGKSYYLDLSGNDVLIDRGDQKGVISVSGLPGTEGFDAVFFYRDGARTPGEPFYGEWTLESGTGLTWDGAVAEEITIMPDGVLILDGREIKMNLVLYPDKPDFTSYRWVFKLPGENSSSFGIFFEEKEPFLDDEDTIVIGL